MKSFRWAPMAFFQQHLRHFQVSRRDDFFQRGAVVVNRFTNQPAQIIHRLAFEPVLKQIPTSGILGVVVTGIRYCQRLDNIRKFLLLRSEHDMNMVGHQAIGVDVTHAFLAITIEFLCKSNSFFSFYKRKFKNVSISPSP